jgi:hypothetical protein
MRHLKLDVQTLAVGIEDQGTAIGVGILVVQISLQESHFPLPIMTVRQLSLLARQIPDRLGGVLHFDLRPVAIAATEQWKS